MPLRGTRRPHVVPITAPSFSTPAQPRVYRRIAYTFVALTLVTVVAVLWLSSVTAKIDVTVRRTPVRLDGSVEVSRTPQPGQVAGRVVQGNFEERREFEVQGANALTATSTDAASGFALTATATATTAPAPTPTAPMDESVIVKGKVKLINKYSKPQTLVKTTRLLTADGKLYRIDRTVTLAPNTEVEVGVYADKAGSAYAIGPSKFTIPGLFVDLQKFIYAESLEAFTGTSVPPVVTTPPVTTPSTTPGKKGETLTAKELDDAYRLLTDAALERAKKTLAVQVMDTNYTEAVYFVKVDKTTTLNPGQTAETYVAAAKVDVTAVFYPKEDMLTLIRNKLREKIPEGREFLPLEQSNVVYTLESADAKSETATVGVKAEGGYKLTPASSQLQKDQFAGKSKDEVVSQIRGLEGVDYVDVTIRPNWLNKVPSLKDHIEVNVK